LPVIAWKNRSLPEVTEACLDALARANDPPELFQHGNSLVRIRHTEFGSFLENLNIDSLRGHMARAATFIRFPRKKEGDLGKQKPIIAFPPWDVAKDILALPSWPLDQIPPLRGIIHSPVFTADGSRIDQPGYHRQGQLWYEPDRDLNVPTVSASPSDAEVAEAKRWLLDELLVDFPFVGPPDRANALAFLLTPFVRLMISGPTPLCIFEAPAAGTGKGLAAKAVAFPALGRPLPITPQPSTDEEWGKTISSLVVQAPPLVLLDNLKKILESGNLEAALTSDIWNARELGTNRMIRAHILFVWLATANNLTVGGDLPRRLVWSRLDAKMENPEERSATQFRHPDLLKWAKEHRGSLVWAALTIVQAWIARGRPVGKQSMGSYEAWAGILGGILDVAQVKGFLGNQSQHRQGSDEEAAQWRELCRHWWRMYQASPVGVKDLYEIVASNELLPWILSAETDQGRRQRLGRALARMRDRCFGDFRILQVGADNSDRKRYQLERIQSASSSAEGDSDFAPSEIQEITKLLYCWWQGIPPRTTVRTETVDLLVKRLGLLPTLIKAKTDADRQQQVAAFLTRIAGRVFEPFRVVKFDIEGRDHPSYSVEIREGYTPPPRFSINGALGIESDISIEPSERSDEEDVNA